MSFEERNAAWQGEPRYFRQTQTRSSSPRFWKCWVEGIFITSEWGQIGGAVQRVSEEARGVNKGKKNEISPEAYALYLGRERCRKKHWEGYRELDLVTSQVLDEHVVAMSFSNPPENLAFWKPDNSPGPGISKKAEEKRVIYTRKMDGMAHPIFCDEEGRVQIYSRRMLKQHDLEKDTAYTWNDRYPHIVEAMQGILPPKSVVLGELVAFDEKNKDNLHLMETYVKSLTPKALEQQAVHGWAYYYVWDIAFWDGQDLVKESPVGIRYELIHEKFSSGYPILPIVILKPGEIEGVEFPVDFREYAKVVNWEGFVMVDPDGVFGDRAYNFKGKPDRPGKFAAKVKPEYEDDFIVLWDPEKGYGEFSTKGRYGPQGMKSACLYQLNSKGEMVYIANVASGLSQETKTSARPSQFPQVWRVIYTSRRFRSEGDDTDAIDFPRFDAVRTDKTIYECVNPKLDMT